MKNLRTLLAEEGLAATDTRMARLDSATLRMFPARSYLRHFFEEKDIPSKVFTVQDNQGLSHDIPNEVVIEHIAQTSPSEQRKIEDILRQIDSANGNINHFLEHLAGAIANSYDGAMRSAGSKQERHPMKNLRTLLAEEGLVAASSSRPNQWAGEKAKAIDNALNQMQKHSRAVESYHALAATVSDLLRKISAAGPGAEGPLLDEMDKVLRQAEALEPKVRDSASWEKWLYTYMHGAGLVRSDFEKFSE